MYLPAKNLDHDIPALMKDEATSGDSVAPRPCASARPSAWDQGVSEARRKHVRRLETYETGLHQLPALIRSCSMTAIPYTHAAIPAHWLHSAFENNRN